MAKSVISFLLVILAAFAVIGCSHTDKAEVKEVITNELNLLKNLDTDTVQKYVSYNELFPDVPEETRLSTEVEEVFSLFSRISIIKSLASMSTRITKRLLPN